MNFNRYISYSREMIEKKIPISALTECDPDHERFSEGLKAEIGNVTIWFGKLPSGRYVYLSSLAVYPLRNLI